MKKITLFLALIPSVTFSREKVLELNNVFSQKNTKL